MKEIMSSVERKVNRIDTESYAEIGDVIIVSVYNEDVELHGYVGGVVVRSNDGGDAVATAWFTPGEVNHEKKLMVNGHLVYVSLEEVDNTENVNLADKWFKVSTCI